MKKFAAKLNRRNDNHVIIFDIEEELSQIAAYKAPQNFEGKLFDPDVSCDDDERYFVELNEEQIQEMLGEYFQCITNSSELNKISGNDYKIIGGLYLVEDQKIIFTKITKSSILEKDTLLSFIPTGGATIYEAKNSINFNQKVNAFYDGEGKLFFKNYSKITSLFKGFSVFYSQATNEQKNEFLGNDFFQAGVDVATIQLGSRSLRKISYILANNIDLTDQTIREKYLSYAGQYKELGINISDSGKLIFNDEKEVANILNLLEEAIYTTPITGRKRVAQASKNIS